MAMADVTNRFILANQIYLNVIGYQPSRGFRTERFKDCRNASPDCRTKSVARLARDLHDSTGQLLTALRMNL